MWYWGNGGSGWGAWLPMTLMMLAFLGAVVVFTRSWISRPPFHDHGEQSTDPKRILDERFARGEIDEEEYHKRKDVLQENR